MATTTLPASSDEFAKIHAAIASAGKDKLPRLVVRKRATSPSNRADPLPLTHRLPPPPCLDLKQYCRDHRFHLPRRRLITTQDLSLFAKSPSHELITGFVFSLSDAARHRKISQAASGPIDRIIQLLLRLLDRIEDLIRQCPPRDQGSSRFGNAAFRDLVDVLSSCSRDWHQELGITEDDLDNETTHPTNTTTAIDEVSTYLHFSLGNRERLDYGSGHELNFVIWLLCLNRLNILPASTFSQVALLVVPRYTRLMRKIQQTYYLEPAGSHGVWGLDDYHFLPFLIGASQLQSHPYITPLGIHNELLLEEEGDEFVYLDMVRFTMESKTIKGIRWTQPMLDDISGAKNWEKIEQGMRRMFLKEVLGKLPVMQHFLFGSLVPAVDGMTDSTATRLAPESIEKEGGQLELDAGGAHHVHQADAWGDCCGIKVPSTVAAVQESRKHGANTGLRHIPFD